MHLYQTCFIFSIHFSIICFINATMSFVQNMTVFILNCVKGEFLFEVLSYFFGTILLKTSELQQLQSKILLWNYNLHKYLSTSNDYSTTCKLKAQLKTHWRKRSVLFDLWVEVFLFSCTSTPLSLWEAEKGKYKMCFFIHIFDEKETNFIQGKVNVIYKIKHEFIFVVLFTEAVSPWLDDHLVTWR